MKITWTDRKDRARTTVLDDKDAARKLMEFNEAYLKENPKAPKDVRENRQREADAIRAKLGLE